MKLNKKDLKLIGEFVDKNNPKLELNYALVGRGGVFATDTRKAIRFAASELQCEDLLVHKKLLKGFEGLMGKDDTAEFLVRDGGVSLKCNGTAMSLDTATFGYQYVDSERILNPQLKNHFALDSLDDIHFELLERFCFVEWSHLSPLVEHSGGHKYNVFFEPQSKDSNGMAKIVASVTDEELGDVVLYEAVVMGREFKSQAKE